MTVRYDQNGITIHEADALQVATTYPANHFTLAILDGPYAMNKAEWDRLKVNDLPRWYRPHLEAADRILAPSASLYLWNTAEGWATLHPMMVSMGWAFRGLITWDKGIGFMAGKCDVNGLRCWYDVTEVCGFYQREEWAPSTCAGQEIAYAAGADDRNWIRLWLGDEWSGAGLKRGEADRALGTNGMAGHYFGASQWSLPTWEAYQLLATYAAEHGAPRERPYLVHPSVWPDGDLRASYDHLRAEYDHLRAEYEASRPAFNCPPATSNVWSAPTVSGMERLRKADRSSIHPCQKPLLFADRMIRASTRPGERVWVPFGGTCREAIAADRIRRSGPADAREVVTCELNQDGSDYLDPVIRILNGEGSRPADPRQVALL
jgi:hypothetical protein